MPATESEVCLPSELIWVFELTGDRCDLTRPCQTCRDRDHPELCSYHPPSKRQNVNQGSSTIKHEDMPASNGGFVTLGRGEFDFLCRKLSALEESITGLRRELGLRGSHHDEPTASRNASTVSAEIDPAVNGHQRRPTHTDIHGVHVKNDVVRPLGSCIALRNANTVQRGRSFISELDLYRRCSTHFR